MKRIVFNSEQVLIAYVITGFPLYFKSKSYTGKKKKYKIIFDGASFLYNKGDFFTNINMIHLFECDDVNFFYCGE